MKNTIKILAAQIRRIYAIAFVALIGFSFAACGNKSSGLTGENPIVTGAKFVRITDRNNYWDTVDIKAGQDFWQVGALYTSGQDHTVTVYGKTATGGKKIMFSQTNRPYDDYSDITTTSGSNGMFTLSRTFTWAEIVKEIPAEYRETR